MSTNKRLKKESPDGNVKANSNDGELTNHNSGKMEVDSDDGGLTKPIPKGHRYYQYYELTKRIVQAPEENDNYTEDELQEFMTKTLVIYRMMLPIAEEKERREYFLGLLDTKFVMARDGDLENAGANRNYEAAMKVYGPAFLDCDGITQSVEELWEKTAKAGVELTERTKVLTGIYELVAKSKLEAAASKDMGKIEISE